MQSKVNETLRAYQGGTTLPWTDVELSVYLIYLYGELQKGVKGQTLPPSDRAS